MRSYRKFKKYYRRLKRKSYRRRRTTRRAPYRRRYYRRQAKARLQRWPLNWGDAVLAKLPYRERFQLPTVVSGNHGLQFSLNNPYDPYYGTLNASATNFGLLRSYYKYCTVYGAKVSFTIYNRSPGAEGNYVITVPYESASSGPSNDDSLFTMKYAQWVTCGNANTKVYHMRPTLS